MFLWRPIPLIFDGKSKDLQLFLWRRNQVIFKEASWHIQSFLWRPKPIIFNLKSDHHQPFYTDKIWCFLKRPGDLSSCFCVDQSRLLFLGSLTSPAFFVKTKTNFFSHDAIAQPHSQIISICFCGDRNTYFKGNHDFLTLARWFLC